MKTILVVGDFAGAATYHAGYEAMADNSICRLDVHIEYLARTYLKPNQH